MMERKMGTTTFCGFRAQGRSGGISKYVNIRKAGAVDWLIGVVSILPKSPDPPSLGFEACSPLENLCTFGRTVLCQYLNPKQFRV